MYGVDIAIIGAGLIGLSIANTLSSSVKHIVVLEKEPGPGRGISSRNSEVIHAGIYYPLSSLKASLCVQGNRMLYEFCDKNNIPFKKIGKVIVAVSENEFYSIEDLFIRGQENGVEGLRILGRKELSSIEPSVQGVGALYSPDTGIIDSHQLTKRLEALCLNGNVSILYKSPLLSLEKTSGGFVCTVEHPDQSLYSFRSRIVINAAGLASDSIASLAGIDIQSARYRIFPVKGEYFRVRGEKHHLVNGLVYPSPEKNLTGLGIHATKDLSGSLKLGPNAFYVNHMDFDVDPQHAREFFESIHDLLPFLSEEDLVADMSGIRPKLYKPGDKIRDFIITREEKRGLDGLINLIGIESPGLTSCLAIGEYVKAMIKESGLI
jgi:L-2-hydroxyglutarate oxidase LhgO